MHKFFANSLFIGKKLENLPHCHSTNQIAGEMLNHDRPPEGTVVITDNQTAGKGQRGAQWESAAGQNLTFSILFYPHFLLIKHQFYLNMIISLGVARALQHELGGKVKIKWPNDILVSDKKICGILIENSLKGSKIEYSITGIGLNVNQKEFAYEKATSLSDLTLTDYDLNDVFNKVIRGIEQYYLMLKAGDLDKIRSDYLDNLYWLNERHVFDAQGIFSGQIVDVDETGKLLVETNHQVNAYDIKEIVFVE